MIDNEPNYWIDALAFLLKYDAGEVKPIDLVAMLHKAFLDGVSEYAARQAKGERV